MSRNPQIVVVGGGTAGLTISAQLLNRRPELKLTIVEPSEKHYYQPLWTLVGAGVFPREESERNESDYIPPTVQWIKDWVESFEPEKNMLKTRGGQSMGYDYLIVCPGIQLNWQAIKGLTKDLIGQYGICSNYSYDTVDTTWSTIQAFSGGTALFSHPAGAVKCAGAPQKICYLAEDYFRQQGKRDKCRIVFAGAVPRIFAVDRYARALEAMIARKGIETHFLHDLVELRPQAKEAVFQILDANQKPTDQQVTIKFDMLHVTPKMGPPDVVKNSPLAGDGGWVAVDQHTTQHVQFKNVFSLGDCSSLPTSKTGAAIRKQAPVTVANLLALIDGQPVRTQYDGYTSCPLVTSYNSLILAEFDYNKTPQESFPFDQSKERFSMYMLKKHALPALYWHGMLRGRA